MRSLNVDPNLVADLIPVDLPVNTMIAAAWYTGVHNPKQNAQIYQITSGSTNPIQWGDMGKQIVQAFRIKMRLSIKGLR